MDGLNSEADRPSCRLRRHPVETFFDNREWLKDFNLEDLSLDPEKAVIEENVFELISQDRSGLFAEGIVALNEWLSGKPNDRVTSAPESPSRLRPAFKKVLFSVLRLLGRSRTVKWTLIVLFGLLLASLLWAAFGLF